MSALLLAFSVGSSGQEFRYGDTVERVSQSL
jgi:hypothetical protein